MARLPGDALDLRGHSGQHEHGQWVEIVQQLLGGEVLHDPRLEPTKMVGYPDIERAKLREESSLICILCRRLGLVHLPTDWRTGQRAAAVLVGRAME